MAGPDTHFWQQRYLAGNTPWDDGRDDPELAEWLARDVLSPQHAPVLVPGCGSGRDLHLLALHGLASIGLDYAPAAVAIARQRLAAAGLSARVEQADVLDWRPTEPVVAVIERTCLCALHPDHWQRYAAQLDRWLQPGGRLFAQFEQVRRDDAADGFVQGPPYHCDMNAMRALFPASRWQWPAPPYPKGASERNDGHLTVILVKLPAG
jgi:SAM-dependent methyltransferase